ncbi:unnamed protein product [[Candida] boidinii]|nr:unnamed protein product [[Candida] boidinii]
MLKSHRGNKIILPKSDISLLDIPDSIKKQLNIPLSTTNFKLCIKSFLTFNTALEFNLLDSTPQDVDDQNSGIDEANDAQQQQFIYIHDDSLIKPFKNFGDSNDNLIGYIAQVSSESTAALENMPINSDQMDIDTLENLENYHYSSISMLIPFADNLWTLIKLNHSNLNEIPILKSLSMSVRNDPLTFDNDNDEEEEEEEEEEFNISDILQSSSSNLTLTSSEFEQS